MPIFNIRIDSYKVRYFVVHPIRLNFASNYIFEENHHHRRWLVLLWKEYHGKAIGKETAIYIHRFRVYVQSHYAFFYTK